MELAEPNLRELSQHAGPLEDISPPSVNLETPTSLYQNTKSFGEEIPSSNYESSSIYFQEQQGLYIYIYICFC